MTVPRLDTGDKLIERILALPVPHNDAAIRGENQRQPPSASRAFVTIACGIRTATLFPHLTTCVSFGIWIYLNIQTEGLTSSGKSGEECGLCRLITGDHEIARSRINAFRQPVFRPQSRM
jgi:hypothetical protein